MTTQKINTWLPKWFNEWLWPVSEEKRKSAERRQNLMRNRRSCMEKWLPGSNHENDYLILNSLTVLPEFERRGIGKALMQEGLEMARKYRVSIYLVASPAGKGLYERLGFDVLDEHEMGDRERVRWRETVMKFEGR